MDLNAPLGRTPPGGTPDAPADPRRPAAPSRLGHIALAACGLVVVGALAAVGIALWTADPHGGEPYVVAAIPPQAAKPPRQVAREVVPATPAPAPLDPTATGSIAPGPHASPALPPTSPLPAVVSQPPNTPLIIDVAKVLAERQHSVGAPTGGPPPEAPLVAPVVAPPPAEPSPEPPAAKAKLAIFVSGMGLSGAATRTATEIMPSAVGFAFVPYGETVPAAVAAAKARGHEILLQVPMQNAQGGAPGPHALRPGEAATQVEADASWLMTRFDGYDGVTNLLGAPVTADRAVMGGLLKAVSEHGLFYLDDGTSARSLGPALAQAQNLPSARADVVLDATADPAVVHANLEALVAVAKLKGSAIGMASGLPDHLAAIAAFAGGLAGRGIELVPVSAVVGRTATRTVAR